GGYGYLGTAITLGLQQAGATVFVLGRTEAKFLEAFPEASNTLRFLPCDVASTEQVEEAMRQVQAHHGSVDVLINNAFYLKGNDPEGITDEEWAYSMDGVIGSVYRCIRAATPYMKAQGSGKIINVSSMYGMVAPDLAVYDEFPQFRNPPHYGAGKAALVQLTKYYAGYLGP
ncbi:MAG TPA: gluconate 5-dehydrogenase, partial [Cytophagales bacterium]|nr:gluconate 5-dehydrogenase [Cytophagales bacterium]